MKFTEDLFIKSQSAVIFIKLPAIGALSRKRRKSLIIQFLIPVLIILFLFIKNCCYFIMHFEPATFILNFFLLLAQFEKIRLIDPKIDIIYLVKRLWNYPVRTSIRPRILFQRKMHNKVLLLVHYRFCKIKRVWKLPYQYALGLKMMCTYQTLPTYFSLSDILVLTQDHCTTMVLVFFSVNIISL